MLHVSGSCDRGNITGALEGSELNHNTPGGHSRPPHSQSKEVRISVLKSANKGVISSKVRMSANFLKKGCIFKIMSAKIEKRGSL